MNNEYDFYFIVKSFGRKNPSPGIIDANIYVLMDIRYIDKKPINNGTKVVHVDISSIEKFFNDAKDYTINECNAKYIIASYKLVANIGFRYILSLEFAKAVLEYQLLLYSDNRYIKARLETDLKNVNNIIEKYDILLETVHSIYVD